MYAVKFIRADQCPDEIYHYAREKDAQYHFDLFVDDTSGLYQRIDLLFFDESALAHIRKTILFNV